MNFKELTLASFAAALALSTGCVVDDDPAGDTDTDTSATTMTVTETNPTMTGPTTGPTTTGPTTTDPDTTDTDPTGDTETDSGDTDTDTDTDDIDPDAYDFREDEADAYAQVDRQGFPAVNTALIGADNKDAYNQSGPTDDIAGTFAGDVIGALDFLHLGNGMGNGFDDELAVAAPALGNPDLCIPPAGANDDCVSQGGPFIFPDVIRIDTAAASAFPNGRDLATPVVDIILAVLLVDVLDNVGAFNGFIGVFADLDLATDGNQGLSQSGNDVEFAADFPYLAPAHE